MLRCLNMKEPIKTVFINGRNSLIFYHNSKSTKKDKAKIYNYTMVKIIDELLKYKENDFKYDKGITTLKTLTSWDEPQLKIKRLANKIAELRKIIPDSVLLTFKSLINNEWKYGVIKNTKNIKLLEDIKADILLYLNNTHSNNKPTKTAYV